MLRVENLYFEYPGIRALDDVSFSIKENSITALVGPNGAGKSTLLRCLTALEEPLSGQVFINNLNVFSQPREAHKKMGFLSDFFGLYDDLTVEQCLRFHAAAHGVKGEKIHSMAMHAAERLNIADRMQQKAHELSRGMRQRLATAQAIVHEPKLLLLDEPASGLDPEARYSLGMLFRELQDQGITLIISSHILTELEEYSTHMLIMKAGKIIAQDSIGEQGDNMCEIRIVLATAYPNLENILKNIENISIREVDHQQAIFSFSSDPSKQHALLAQLTAEGLSIATFAQEKFDMNEIYLSKIQNGERSNDH